MSILEIRDLRVAVDDKQILNGVDLTVRAGETHAIMGPNGSGKSTLAYAIAGHPKYTVTGGEVLLDGENVLEMSVDERARAGLFLAMQYPVEVPGVSVSNFLRSAVTAVRGEAPKLREFSKELRAGMDALAIDPSFAQRNLNEGFSGGEKKRHEILQLELLKPKIAILDETDSGLDVDALRVVSEGINRFRGREGTGVLLITHYTRILRYVKPDYVHVFAGGRVVEEGGPELAEQASRPRATSATSRPRRRRRDLLGPARRRDGDDEAAMSTTFDVERIRKDFPILSRELPGGRPLVYLDSGNSSQKPTQVIEAMREHMAAHYGNVGPRPARARQRVHRGVRGRPRQGGRVHRRAEPRRDRVHQERLRGAQPRRVLLRQPDLHRRAVRAWAPVTRSSSPRWSTTPTSCRGSSSPSAPAPRCAGSR